MFFTKTNLLIDSKELIHWHKLTLLQIVCANIFLLSSLIQLQSNFILANLRKSENNKVVFDGYKVPHGGLFEYLSTPLQFTEILMYLMLSIILWQSNTFHYITFWVVINQVSKYIDIKICVCVCVCNFLK